MLTSVFAATRQRAKSQLWFRLSWTASVNKQTFRNLSVQHHLVAVLRLAPATRPTMAVALVLHLHPIVCAIPLVLHLPPWAWTVAVMLRLAAKILTTLVLHLPSCGLTVTLILHLPPWRRAIARGLVRNRQQSSASGLLRFVFARQYRRNCHTLQETSRRLRTLEGKRCGAAPGHNRRTCRSSVMIGLPTCLRVGFL